MLRMGHLLLHSPVALIVWLRLFVKANLSWEIPATCVALFVRSTSKLEEERGTVIKKEFGGKE